MGVFLAPLGVSVGPPVCWAEIKGVPIDTGQRITAWTRTSLVTDASRIPNLLLELVSCSLKGISPPDRERNLLFPAG